MFHIAKAKEPPAIPENLNSIALDFLHHCFKLLKLFR